MFKRLRWEQVLEEGETGHCTYRAAVPGGWLVAVWALDFDKNEVTDWGGGLTFVPDPTHAWVIDDSEAE